MKNMSTGNFRKYGRTSYNLLFIFVIIGLIIGSLYAVKGGQALSPWLHQYFMPVYSGKNLFEILKNTFLTAVLFEFAVFIFGLSAVGQPIGAAMLIYRGFGVGISAAQMYILYGSRAFVAVSVLILPKAVMLLFISFLSVRELIRSSSVLLRFLIGKDTDNDKYNFRLYCVKFVVLIFLAFLIASTDAAINYFFRSKLLT